jgi:hypothetical protein
MHNSRQTLLGTEGRQGSLTVRVFTWILTYAVIECLLHSQAMSDMSTTLSCRICSLLHRRTCIMAVFAVNAGIILPSCQWKLL